MAYPKSNFVNCIAFSHDETKLYICDDYSTIGIWDLTTDQMIAILGGHTLEINQIILSRDEKILYSCSDDGTIRIWDLETYQEIAVLYGHEVSVSQMILTQNEKLLYSCSDDATIRIWDLKNCQEISKLNEHEWEVNQIILSKNEKVLYSCSSDCTIRIWDTNTYQNIGTLTESEEEMNGIYRMILSQDEKIFYAYRGYIKIWDLKIPQLITTLISYKRKVGCLLFHDEKHLYSYNDNNIKIWDLVTHKEIATIIEPEKVIYQIFLSHDKKFLYGLIDNNIIKIWDLTTHREIILIISSEDDIDYSIAITTDDKYLYGYGWNIWCWDLTPLNYKEQTLMFSRGMIDLSSSIGRFTQNSAFDRQLLPLIFSFLPIDVSKNIIPFRN